MNALDLTMDELRAVAEALSYHYLAGAVDEAGTISGYGVLLVELTESERALRASLHSASQKIERDLALRA